MNHKEVREKIKTSRYIYVTVYPSPNYSVTVRVSKRVARRIVSSCPSDQAIPCFTLRELMYLGDINR